MTSPLRRPNVMPAMPLRSICLALLLGVARALGQAAPTPVVTVAPVAADALPLISDAAGVTQVRLDGTSPSPRFLPAALARPVANLHLGTSGTGMFSGPLSLRGLTHPALFGEPAVTAYLDDLPLGPAFGSLTSLPGFSTATVHRGPQGTLLGAGGEAGVIVLASPEPGREPAGELRLAVGSGVWRHAALTARSSGQDSFDATLAGSTSSRHGRIRNLTLGTRVDDQESATASVRLRFRPSPTTGLSLQLLGQRRQDGAMPSVPLSGSWSSVARDREDRTRSDLGGVAFKASFGTALGQLTATTSHTAASLAPAGSPPTALAVPDFRVNRSQRTWSEEIRLTSDLRSVVTWHAGAWFSTDRTGGEVIRFVPADRNRFRLRSRTTALFGEASIPPNLGWNVTAGLRLEENERDFEGRTAGSDRATAAQRHRALLPKLSLSYAVTNETTLAATLASGRKSGGWSAATNDPALAGFRPERATTAELGIDSHLPDKTLTVAARAFAYALRDYQIGRAFTAREYLVVNAPRARSLGGEAELVWRPRNEFTLTAVFGAAQVTLERFTDPLTGRILDGREAPFVPRQQAHLIAAWRPRAGWFMVAEATATGRIRHDESDTPAATTPGTTLIDARTGWESARWRVTLFGDNLTDHRHATVILPALGQRIPGAPRTWGVEAALKW